MGGAAAVDRLFGDKRRGENISVIVTHGVTLHGTDKRYGVVVGGFTVETFNT